MRIILSMALISLASCFLPDSTDDQKKRKATPQGITVDDVLFDQSAEMLGTIWLLRSGQDFLSAAAQENLKKYIEKRGELRTQMMSICGVKPALSDDDKKTIGTIKTDTVLGNDEKKAKIKSLLNARMETNQRAIDSCKKDKADSLMPYSAETAALKVACMIQFKPDDELAGLPTKKARAWQRMKTLTNDEKVQITKKLESRECVIVLSQ